MTRRERVKAALRHETPDKLPSCIHLAGDGQSAYFDRLYDKYVDPEIRRLQESGLLSKSNAIYYGIGNHVLPVGCPWWGWANLPAEYSREDSPGYLPQTVGHGSYERFAEDVRNIRENTDTYILVTIWGSHFEKANFARGIENFLADIAGDPEFAQSLLDFIIHKNLVMLENIVSIPGIDGILLGSDWGSQRDLLMSPESWRKMIRPGEEKEYKIIKDAGIDVWIHSCGDIRRIMPDLRDMGIDALNPIQPECMDIFELKDLYGDRIAFWGGISTQRTLPYGTPAEVAEESERIAAYMGRDGGYILAPSQEIQADVPFENLCALIDTANRL